MTFTEKQYLHALNTIIGLGAQKFKLLMDSLGSAQAIWEANETLLLKSGIGPALTAKIIAARPHIDIAQKWQLLKENRIEMLSAQDQAYPALLREIFAYPYLIYIKGNRQLLQQKSIAIVGSRAHTSYGRQVAYALAQELARAGVVVVSGLALGIDALAHRGALDAEGKTIAVMGNSLDNASLHPRANYHLAQEILAKDGLLVSEYPPVTPANVGTFPARNRIMAGLSDGTLVVEAAPASGSLITARLALEFNRNVYAVPGPIGTSQSMGTNELLKSGAKLVTNVQDILEDFALAQTLEKIPPCKLPADLSENEKNILQKLSAQALHIDIIIKLSKLETAVAISTLTILEIKGLVKNMGGQNYIKL